ncbi:MAG: hypothetical protein K6T83_01170 [Alicyclobacillus sp.]|nr:hypothetical protein [Alicyclobacillus sp.]
MTDKFKTVTIKDHEYRIGKFSARDGAFIVAKLAGILAPAFNGLSAGMKDVRKPQDIDLSALDFGKIFAPLASLREDDFHLIQDKCLHVCQVKLSAGYVPIVNDNGSFALEELEDDAAVVMALTVHAIIHNLASFFGGSPLMGFVGTILGMTSPPSQT